MEATNKEGPNYLTGLPFHFGKNKNKKQHSVGIKYQGYIWKIYIQDTLIYREIIRTCV